MAKGLSLYIGADTKDAVKGVDKIGDGLEKLQDELGDTVKDSAKLERNFSADMKDLEAASGRASKNIGDDFKKNTSRAGDSVREFKSEAVQNFSETASSFDGSLSGVADGIQGTFGGLASSLPLPLGVAFGLIGAAGGALFQQMSEDAEASKERIVAAFDDMLESGQKFVSNQFLTQAIADIVSDPALYSSAEKYAENLGLSVSTVVAAMAGAPAEVEKVAERVGLANDKLTEDFAGSTADVQQQADLQIQANNDILAAVQKRSDEYGTAAGKVIVAEDAISKTTSDGVAANQNRQDAETRRFQNLKTKHDEASKLAPIDIPVNLSDPGVSDFVTRIQRDINDRRINVPVDIFYRNGVTNP
ncbi:hypothetical protein QMG83_14525 [Salinibacterium sp. G-O1]|uniref:hypothetical protein n=1 Tax=Salinibacterium sp. G-O1 TaxID=3046208 RepID=UPI0024BAB624|nr:hypothetical protein [Salinibacterium sp. G-O1]MDJ0336439.1 hypothetical protein [Salinibacterium sp. G-O1]